MDIITKGHFIYCYIEFIRVAESQNRLFKGRVNNELECASIFPLVLFETRLLAYKQALL